MYTDQNSANKQSRSLLLPALLDQIASVSTRPRYAFMLLNLIAEVADANGSAGPYVLHPGGTELLRDWLCDALVPMAQRDPKRRALKVKICEELGLPKQPALGGAGTQAAVDDEVRARVRAAGKANLSRAVTELVKAGLLERHYEGYRIDHKNRGAQRHAVYTLAGSARTLLVVHSSPDRGASTQGELPFH
jgi:hypothetical protein